MGYRDELEAAQRRAAKLELDLTELRQQISGQRSSRARADTHSKSSLALMKELAEQKNKARHRIEALEAELAKQNPTPSMLEQRCGKLEEQLAEATDKLDAALLQRRPPTLYEHNAGFEPLGGDEPLSVVCPQCRRGGDYVMLRRNPANFGLTIWAAMANKVDSAWCPRCLFIGFMRTTE